MANGPIMDAGRLTELLERFASLRAAVVGDFYQDLYLDCDPALAEKSFESGRTAHQVVNVRHSPGAAGTVAQNLASLGTGKLYAVGFSGDDGPGLELRRDLNALGIDTTYFPADVGRRTPIYLKPRDITRLDLTGEHDRYDIKNRTPTPPETRRRILESVDALLPTLDALLCMEQAEDEDAGVLTRDIIAALSERARRFPKVVFWADSRRRIASYKNMNVKMNQFEAIGRYDPLPGEEVDPALLERTIPGLRRSFGAPVFVTVAERGMYVSDPRPARVPGVHLQGPLDPTGAGDSASAGCVLALAAGGSPAEAALLGNLVASVTVRKLGVTGTASRDEVAASFELWREQNQ
jgi:sugar/nucleoside kinase (ribokinase family)